MDKTRMSDRGMATDAIVTIRKSKLLLSILRIAGAVFCIAVLGNAFFGWGEGMLGERLTPLASIMCCVLPFTGMSALAYLLDAIYAGRRNDP